MPIRVSMTDELVRVVWEGSPDDEAILSCFADVAAASRRVARYAILYDFRAAHFPSARQRRLLAELSRAEGPTLRKNCVGVAFVIAAAPIRAALTAMLWHQPMKLPYSVAGVPEDAERWLRERCRLQRGAMTSAV